MPLPDQAARRQILTNTISRTEDLVELYQDAKDSIFLAKNLPAFEKTGLPVDQGRNQHMLVSGHAQVQSGDQFHVACCLLDNHADYKHKVLVLNCCSGENPGGKIEERLGVTPEDHL